MEAVSYQCPNCGAPLEFHSETQKWDCKFCLSSFEESDLEEYNRKQEQKQKEEQEEEWIEESPRDEFVAPPTFVDSSLLSKTTMQRRLVHGDENMETKRHIMLQCFNDGMTMCLQVLPQKQEHIPERNVRESEVIEEEELPCDDDPQEEDEIMYMGEGKE